MRNRVSCRAPAMEMLFERCFQLKDTFHEKKERIL
jgi:hypothetical protein